MGTVLDNPVWHSLCDAHLSWATGTEHVKWYSPDVAPFIAVAEPGTIVDGDPLAASRLQSAYIVGVAPDVLPDGWRVEATFPVLQMIYAGEPVAALDRPFVELSTAHRPKMSELAGIAFPDFFRARTGELGTYFGVFADERLVAMAAARDAAGRGGGLSGSERGRGAREGGGAEPSGL